MVETRVPGPGLSRRARIALGVAALIVLLLAALWLARLPLATRFVDRELARAGVPARYTLAGLGPRGQRLENVRLGDPADPDLVADWIETETGLGLSGPYLDGVRAGHVRIKARLVDGRVSLGSLDRLLPAPSGKPFALPTLRVAGEDVRVRLATPYGPVGLKLGGAGRLDDGFRGTLAAVAPRLALGGCVAEGMRASVRLTIRDAAPTVAGPVRAAKVACGDAARASAVGVDVAASLGAALARWQGTLKLATGRVDAPQAVRLGGLAGSVAFAGDAEHTRGSVDLTATGVAAPQATARTASARGSVAIDGAGVSLGKGAPATVSAAGVRLAEALLRRADAIGTGAPATPMAPLLAQVARAGRAAGSGFDATAIGALIVNADGGEVSIREVTFGAASGADGRWRGAAALAWGEDADATLDGRLSVAGGGLPSLAVQLRRTRTGAVAGVATMAPYAAGDARLALTPVRFALGRGGGIVETGATLSGPLGGGRVEALTLPIRARLSGGALALNPDCTPVAAAALRVSGLVLDRPRATLCATGPALVRVAGGGVAGGARLPELRLRGSLGSSPLAIDGEGARVDLASRGFAIEGLRTTIGAPERETRLNFAALDGRIDGGAVTGGFSGGTGRIGAVPLALGEAAGDWRFAGGALDVDGALVVADTADVPRFQPMHGQGVRLRLADNAIDATGSLVEPTTGTRVAGVTIAHALGSGVGHADLAVPGIAFRDGFQPELLTRVTFGVIADVKGTVTGSGRIDWTPAGVTSTGRFRTDGTDLAAAFGPVAGIAGEIAFDDLLSLRSAPNQRVTVRSINPGIEVTDGIIRFRTLSGTQVQVDSGHWPFAGGSLTLQPTLLDFGEDRARRMTFVVTRAAADKFLQQFAFDNLQATGTFDGTLPMVFDGGGGRIEGGRLAMREGGGTIAYLGDLTQKDLGFWGNLAFQSLRSLRYRNLDITMNGPLAGEMVTEVKFAGVSQGEGAKSNFIIRRLQRLPFVFNIRIQAPFRGLLDSVQSFYDPKRLIGRNLPALLDAQQKRVQPPASEKVP